MPSISKNVARARRRKVRTEVRIQIHVYFPRPKSRTIAPEVIQEAIDRWIDEGYLHDAIRIKYIDWSIKEGNRERSGRVKGDQADSIRENMIRRFRGSGPITVHPFVGKSESESES